MHKKFLQYLIDPNTGENLTLEGAVEKNGTIQSGFLVSAHHRYPIVRGVPRFAGYQDDSNYTKSFGYQWNRWSKIQFDSENTGRPYEGYTQKMWEKIVGSASHDIKQRVIVDVGCGPGRFIETVVSKGGLAIGLDYSDAVEAARENFADNENVLICQADILASPIRPQSVDGAFSIGVLHHTPDPERGFHNMAHMVKPGGWAAVSVYSPGGHYDNFFVNLWRKLFKALWPIFGHYPPLAYSYAVVYATYPILKIPLLRTLIRPFFAFTPFISLKDIRWSVLDTFDSVTPSNQYAFTPYQVFQWFKKAQLRNIEPSNWGGGSFNGHK